MTLTGLIAQYGYLVVFVGAFIEGETVLVLAGFAAHQGYLSLPWVMLLALCGGALGDQVCFFLGRHYGQPLLLRFPSLAPGVQRVDRLLERYHAWLIIGMRFLYGLRLAGPIAIGMSRLPAWRFVAFNLTGAAIWAPLIAGAGFLFGHTLELLFADIKRFEEAVLLLIVAIAAVVGLRRRLRRH
jgi:membrane protein DedA with SNARE-associated domain